MDRNYRKKIKKWKWKKKIEFHLFRWQNKIEKKIIKAKILIGSTCFVLFTYGEKMVEKRE